MKTLELREYETATEEGYALSPEERMYLHRLSVLQKEEGKPHRFRFAELRNGLRLEAGSWVGVIQLDSLRIHILPKFRRDFDDLLRMIAFTEQIPFHMEHDTAGQLGRTSWN